MPIYEYRCGQCGKVSSFLVRSVEAHKPPSCPKCGEKGMSRVFSRFATTGRGSKSKPSSEPGGATADDFGGAGDDALDDMPELAELENVDEENPRALGRAMRKIAEKSGEKLDPEMDEVCRRLESGEDPESIEEKMGDAEDGGGEGGDDTLYDA
jgi:putative FmdB family regulatory protein